MKLAAPFDLVAFAASLHGTVAAGTSGPLEQAAAAQPRHILGKRDAYTCYGNISATVSDCQAAISQVGQDGPDVNFMLREDVCLNWDAGTCAVRFCAQPYVLEPINRTAAWLMNYLTDPLLNCVRGGQFALMGDRADINSDLGTYRLHLEEPDWAAGIL
ncbi:hypothetical protein GGR56DRAFT_132408 [Xylariaceae sp. FL0804]|nr:hypothetical protein GGR56DRAFT_132408 [Xylariaceae sp. FL0804]